MGDWYFFGGLAIGAAVLAGRALLGRTQQDAAASASGLAAVRDLSHLPQALQRSALWSLADGGFESRVVHGVVSKGAEDIDVTAFDLETLRERRGEWAYLPVERPFRIAGVVSVTVCEIDRVFPHYVLKRNGLGDDMLDDNVLERLGSLPKVARESLMLARSHPAELPPALDAKLLAAAGIDAPWRAYGRDAALLADLAANGFGAALARAERRDLVVELIDNLVIVYPAARDLIGADAFADLTSTAVTLVEGLLAASPRITPRGVESRRP